jgi:hypothetical protein
MNIKYIGMDVHKETISIAVMNSDGKVVMESIIETKASTILQSIQGIRGDLHVTFEEGTWAAWLHDLLKPHVTELVVCDPRKNALLKDGNKSDKIDARKLADLLRGGYLRSVYHGENGLRTLKELARSYLTISKDLTRVMNRVKALYRSWGILCVGQQVYAPRYRAEWLNKIGEAGVRRRAEFFYQQLDALRALRQDVRRDLLAESQKQSAMKILPRGAEFPIVTVRTRLPESAASSATINADLEIQFAGQQSSPNRTNRRNLRDQEIALSIVANALASRRMAHTLGLMQWVRHMVGECALFEDPLAVGGKRGEGHEQERDQYFIFHHSCPNCDLKTDGKIG